MHTSSDVTHSRAYGMRNSIVLMSTVILMTAIAKVQTACAILVAVAECAVVQMTCDKQLTAWKEVLPAYAIVQMAAAAHGYYSSD